MDRSSPAPRIALVVGTHAHVAGAGATFVRVDIQVYRAVAVLLVLFYHAGLAPFRAGYLGVDVFFVISGYLMTRMVTGSMARGDFSFAGFYFRRAKRLLPASLAVVAMTALAAPLLLGPTQYRELSAQVLGAVTFTANVFLWRQSGYFASASESKPLLHFWSLSLEEQFYLFLPLALFLCPRRFRFVGVVAVAATSLVLFAVLGRSSPAATFYFLPTRCWELLVGSLGALGLERPSVLAALRRLRWPALATIILIPVVPFATVYLASSAVVVCLATLILLVAPLHELKTLGVIRPFVMIGDWSYSLYLVHWPLFAFAASLYVRATPLHVRLALLAASFGLAYLLHALVEDPIRRSALALRPSVVVGALLATIAVGALPHALGGGAAPWAAAAPVVLPEGSRWVGESCFYDGAVYDNPECRSRKHPYVLLWGDSFAMHLAPGMAATSQVGFQEIALSACGPLVGLSGLNTKSFNRYRAEECLRFGRAALEYVRHAKDARVVVLASPFDQLIDDGRDSDVKSLLVDRGGRYREVRLSEDLAVDAMRDTIAAIRASGKKVVVVAPPPASGFDLGRCVERKLLGLPRLGESADCDIRVDEYHRFRGKVRALLDRIAIEADVNVFSFDAGLCDEHTCLNEIDGIPLYRDGGHLSFAGSILVARKVGLVPEFLRLAR